MITESQSHFERSERVKRFIEVSSRRRHPKLCRARRMIQRLVTVCISPSLQIKWIHMPAFFFNFRSLDLSLLHACFWGAYKCRVTCIRRNGNYKWSGVVWGHRSAWFPLLTARRFAEFDTSVICHAVPILCLASFLLQDNFKALSIGSPGTKIKIFCEPIAYLHSILWRRARLFWLELFGSTVRCTNIILAHIYQSSSSFSSETAVALLREGYTFF